MKRLFLMFLAMFGFAAMAQQNATLSGIIVSEEALPESTRVAIHLVDSDGVWDLEVGSVVPVAGTFSITAVNIPAAKLRPFHSGAVLLPGLQNEYRVSPDDVGYAQGRINMYVDHNGNEMFDRGIDAFFIGVSSLEDPVGFFSLIYVDKDATMVGGSGVTLELKRGWNIFSVRFPAEEGPPAYSLQSLVEDAVLDVFLP